MMTAPGARLARTLTLGLAVAAAAALAAHAADGPCDAHFRFDGSLADSSGNGYDGSLVVAGGDPAPFAPTFAPGKFGEALVLDGRTVMMSPLDLQTEDCPQVTIAAWVFLDEPLSVNQLVSTGYGRGPAIDAGIFTVAASAGGNKIRSRNSPIRGQWIFVAGTWDYDALVHRLYWRHRWEEKAFAEQQRPPQNGFWVGGDAYFTGLNYIADGVLIDDVRVWGRVLTEEELRAVQAAGNPALAPCDCDGGTESGTGVGGGFGDRPTEIGYVPPPDPADLIGGSSPGPLGGSRSGSVRDPIDTSGIEGSRPQLPIDPGLGSGDSGGDDPEPGGSASGGTPEPEPPVTATGPPRPTGEPAYSAVAGNVGGNKRTLDMRDAFLHSVWWSEKNDKPCYIRVSGRRDGEVRTETLSLGCTLGLKFHAANVNGYGVGRLEVCNNDNSKGRLKGIRLFGTKIENDGTTTYVPISDEESLPNCAVWSSAKLCPGDKLATGLVVHSNDGSGNVEQIVGLQLICRDITVEAE